MTDEIKEVSIEFVDRYSATGTPRPDVNTMCLGQCEGMGCVPVSSDDKREPWRSLWLEAEAKKPTDDGWHFVTCPDCNGTRLRPVEERTTPQDPELFPCPVCTAAVKLSDVTQTIIPHQENVPQSEPCPAGGLTMEAAIALNMPTP